MSMRPSAAELAAAHGRTIADVLTPDLRVLFCGINPGLWSAATGLHFARPGNRFWPALHRGGFTPRLLRPQEQADLLRYGLGITNLAARADELTAAELVEGGVILRRKLAQCRPGYLAVLGIGAYRTAFQDRTARIGAQDHSIEGVPVWVLPNPSGLNAHFNLDELAAQFAALREAAR